ncbi:MAG: hypothetical protein AB7O67_23990, partial [Vicinamibacterales bacterium]
AALTAAGLLAVGAGAAWFATRPSPDSAPASEQAATAPVTDPAVAPAITEPDPDAPTDVAAPERPAARPAPARPTPAPARESNVPPASQVPRQPPASQSIPPAVTASADARPASAASAAATPTPAAPMFEELVVSANAVIDLQLDATVSSEDAQVEDRVVATVTRDVRVGDRVAIPAGSKAHGEVTLVERGGKIKERARLAVRFTGVTLGNGTRVPISTEAILREGESAAKESAAKIGGGAIGGAIIGGIIGGKKGAAIGSTVGAGAGTTAVMAGGRNAAVFESGSPVSVKLLKPAAVTVDR